MNIPESLLDCTVQIAPCAVEPYLLVAGIHK